MQVFFSVCTQQNEFQTSNQRSGNECFTSKGATYIGYMDKLAKSTTIQIGRIREWCGPVPTPQPDFLGDNVELRDINSRLKRSAARRIMNQDATVPEAFIVI